MSPLLVGAAIGATNAFILDPQQGRRRRALVRNKLTRRIKDGRYFADAAHPGSRGACSVNAVTPPVDRV